MPSKNRRISLTIPPYLSDAIDEFSRFTNGIPAATLCSYLISKGLSELGFLHPEDYD